MRRLALVVCCFGMLLALGACGPSDQDAVFIEYETAGTGEYRQPINLTGDKEPALTIAQPEIRENTGNAVVKVDNMEVVAVCPVQGLSEGDAILARQNDDGTWTVVGLR